jgi:hypothetical protein
VGGGTGCSGPNLLQFLGGIDDERIAWISATSSAAELPLDDLWLMSTVHASAEPPPSVPAPREARLSSEMADELELVIDDDVRTLVETALRSGAPDFVAGREVDGEPIDATWPAASAGIDAARAAPVGWNVGPASSWTIDDVLSRLEEAR